MPFTRKLLFSLAAIVILFSGAISRGEEAALIKLNGISAGMRARKLLDSWGFPAKRERKAGSAELWFYLNDNTPNPTDGVIVRLKKNAVESWSLSDNMYSEMAIWGKEAGDTSRRYLK